jgi:HEPN domain-containing protein
MPPELSKNDLRVIVAYIDDAALDLDAAMRLIADPPNRLAGFHLQQAAEKLVKAVRLYRGLLITADHSIARLAEELLADDPWRTKLAPLAPLTSYATSFRYPSPTGNRKDGPRRDEVLGWIQTIGGLISEARGLVKPGGG